jgi:DedD protein
MDEKLKQMRKSAADLSDIVLEKESKKSESTKKWILTIAAALILFLIILIIMKMLNQPDVRTNEENIAAVGESVETISQEEPADVEKIESKKEENLFKKEPIIDETSDTDLKFEEMVKKLKEQEAIEEAPAPVVKKEVVVKKVEKIKKEVPVITTEVEQTPTIIETTPPPAQIVKRETITVAPPKPKPAPITKPKKEIAKTFEQVKLPTVSGYFIQVGATARAFPDKRFLNKIKSAGFDYIVHSVIVKGKKIKKVLIGPYSSRDRAKAVLPKVKSMINPSAYIYRLK